MNSVNLEQIIEKLLSACGPTSCKNANLTEEEITFLCVEAREIFMGQPIFLELEAPLKICGKISNLFKYVSESGRHNLDKKVENFPCSKKSILAETS